MLHDTRGGGSGPRHGLIIFRWEINVSIMLFWAVDPSGNGFYTLSLAGVDVAVPDPDGRSPSASPFSFKSGGREREISESAREIDAEFQPFIFAIACEASI